MLSQETQNAVKEIVGKMTEADEMFSAFDVTHIVRNTVDGEAPHYEIKAIVHSMFGNNEIPSDYVRSHTSFDSNDKQVTSWVYHPQWKSLDNYDPKRFQEVDGDPFPVDKSSVAKNKTSPSIVTVPDKRGRVCVPAPMIRKLGLYPGKSVFVAVSNDKLYVIEDAPKFASFLTQSFLEVRRYVIDKSRNVRMSRFFVDQAQLAGTPKFAVKTLKSGDKVIEVYN